jgi:hypothetical protein
VFKTGLCEGDVIVTGEMRHHDALTVLRRGACAIVVGHWTSERPALQSVAKRLAASLPGLAAVSPPHKHARGREKDSLAVQLLLTGSATFTVEEYAALAPPVAASSQLAR